VWIVVWEGSPSLSIMISMVKISYWNLTVVVYSEVLVLVAALLELVSFSVASLASVRILFRKGKTSAKRQFQSFWKFSMRKMCMWYVCVVVCGMCVVVCDMCVVVCDMCVLLFVVCVCVCCCL